MKLEQIKPGKNLPEDINVVIEIPANSSPIKYEVDKESETIWVDRFMATPMFYPANYGFVPNTLADDGDPLDVLVVTPYPLIPGAVINARPLGVLVMSDDGGVDSKIVAVPIEKLTPIYNDIKDINDLPKLLIQQIEHFFENYKDLEKGKWVKIDSWEGIEKAKEIIKSSLK